MPTTHVSRSPILKLKLALKGKSQRMWIGRWAAQCPGEGVLPRCGQQGSDELRNVKGLTREKKEKSTKKSPFLLSLFLPLGMPFLPDPSCFQP